MAKTSFLSAGGVLIAGEDLTNVPLVLNGVETTFGAAIGSPGSPTGGSPLSALGAVCNVAPQTSVVINIGTDVASLDLALSGVAQWSIPTSSTVSIVLPPGNTARSAPVVVNHPFGSQISILGQPSVAATVTSAGSVTGSMGAWSVPLVVTSSAGISGGDYVLVRNVSGTGRYLIFSGICRVSAVAGNLVTVVNTAKNATWPAAALTGASITCLKSRITFTGCDGFQIDGALGSLDKLAVVGSKTPGTIGVIAQRMALGSKQHGYVTLGLSQSFGISGFGDGGIYAQYSGTVDAGYVCVADCLVYNFLAQHSGSLNANFAISSGCSEAGFTASSGAALSAQNSIAVGNGTYGYFAFQGGALLAQTSFSWANVSDGLRASWGGSIRGTTIDSQFNGGSGFFTVGGSIVATSGVASNNSGTGLYAEGGGSLYASGTVMASNSGFGAYADGAVIDAPGSSASSNGQPGYAAVDQGTILADALSGAGNGAYLVSASRGGFVRATNASTSGATLYTDTSGVVDATGATGSPTLTTGPEGMIVGASTKRGSVLLDAGSSIAIGTTNSAALNIDKASASYLRLAKGGALGTLIGIDDGSSLVVGAESGDTVVRSSGALWFAANGANERGFIDSSGNAALGRASLGTGSTDGFFYIPSCPGTPAGTPTTKAGRVALCADATNGKVYAYVGGSWKNLGP